MKHLREFILEGKSVKDFIIYLKENNGFAPVSNPFLGDGYYFCKILNDDNFDFSKAPKLKEQLKQDGMYDRCYASGSVYNIKPGEKISVDVLPIYGDKTKYVTKWFSSNMDDIVKRDLADRGMNLKKRIKFFTEN